jgi:hypothetical protein
MTTPAHSNLSSVSASAGPLKNASEITSQSYQTNLTTEARRLRGKGLLANSVSLCLCGLNRRVIPNTILSLGKHVLALLFLFAVSLTARTAMCGEAAEPFQKVVAPFLGKYCVACHGSKKQKGDRRFDRLSGKIVDDNSLVDLQNILDQLNLSEMPPEEAPQPTVVERRDVIRWLTSTIEDYNQTRAARHQTAALRRLNSREYRNSVRDLLHLNMTIFDPTRTFPRDQMTEHLDTVGDTLVTSGALLQQYLNAAETVVNKAVFPLEKPPVQKWVFHDGFNQQPEIDQVHKKSNGFRHMTLYDVVGADKPEGAYGPIHAFADGVPHDGYYEIKLKAEALNRRHDYPIEFLGTDPDEPFRLGIVAGNKDAGTLHLTQPIEPLLAEIELADEQRSYTVRVWLDAGFTPRFTFRNGLIDVRSLWGKLAREYGDRFPKRKTQGIVDNRINGITHGNLPQIRIHEIEIEGPFYDEWPTAGQRAVFGEDFNGVSNGTIDAKTLGVTNVRVRVTEFASRAYRRPATSEEIDRIIQVVKAREAAGRTSLEAFCDGMTVILCSPGFLYQETADEGGGFSAEGLASRLSYFLWSSMPDQELRHLAANGELTGPAVLAAQVDQMIADKRSDQFIEGFLNSWLTMRDLGATPPDRTSFRSFYHYDLDTAMRQETRLFVRELLDRNLSIENFLDSDFTFLNKRLAEHYGIVVPLRGSDFQKVSLTDRRRGGLLGQASVLTVTANGIDTSPVVRGVWLLENILGTPPSPPPPDVEPIDPDTRGATTIREQLEKHRSVASCNDCHRKIDPPGFALENFDPIGGWRTSYGRGKKIDASGQLATGQKFQDVTDFKKLLLARKDLFARALTTKLLAYSLGRHVGVSDRRHVDRIVAQLGERGNGFRDLIKLVVTSEPFFAP